MKKSADARFAIKSWDETPYSDVPDLPRLTRASVIKSLTPQLESSRACVGMAVLPLVMVWSTRSH